MMKAKKLIYTARECGADAVKGQAFLASDMLEYGTMPKEFYQKAALKFAQYKELIDFGNELDIPVFFTIISQKFSYLMQQQKYRKIHAGAFKKRKMSSFKDESNMIISTNGYRPGMDKLKKVNFLYASPYLKDHNRQIYEALVTAMERPIGLSHHGQGVDGLLDMINRYEIPIIEKHFFLGDRIVYGDKVYRDCLHSANPKVFEFLANEYKKGKAA